MTETEGHVRTAKYEFKTAVFVALQSWLPAPQTVTFLNFNFNLSASADHFVTSVKKLEPDGRVQELNKGDRSPGEEVDKVICSKTDGILQ